MGEGRVRLTELGELGLVHAYDVVVRLGDAGELVLQVLDGAWLG